MTEIEEPLATLRGWTDEREHVAAVEKVEDENARLQQALQATPCRCTHPAYGLCVRCEALAGLDTPADSQHEERPNPPGCTYPDCVDGERPEPVRTLLLPRGASRQPARGRMMTGRNYRHYNRCDQGGSSEARPEQKMGRLHRWPPWESPFVEAHLTSPVRKVLKHAMAKKRRQRDRTSL